MKYFNLTNAPITLPSGETIPRGSKQSVDVSADDAKHPVVKAWINEGFLSKDAKATSASKSATTKTVEVKVADLDDPAVKAAIDAAKAEGKAEALAPVVEAWLELASVPVGADEATVDAADKAMAAALGLDG